MNEMNPTQKQFSLNRGASRKQIPISNMTLDFEGRLKLHKDSGSLIHSFGDGYFIVDENGEEVNAFSSENEFNRLIEKFKHRHFLTEKLNKMNNDKFMFGEDNTLIINDIILDNIYWNLPINEKEVEEFFQFIYLKFSTPINPW